MGCWVCTGCGKCRPRAPYQVDLNRVCPNCGYDATDSVEANCPQCGTRLPLAMPKNPVGPPGAATPGAATAPAAARPGAAAPGRPAAGVPVPGVPSYALSGAAKGAPGSTTRS